MNDRKKEEDNHAELMHQFDHDHLAEQAASSSRSAEVAELLGISQRSRPKCALCAAHGLSIASLGHKRTCPYQQCSCKHCWIIRERRRFVAKQMRNRRDQMKHELQQVRQRRSEWQMAARPISASSSDLTEEDSSTQTQEEALTPPVSVAPAPIIVQYFYSPLLLNASSVSSTSSSSTISTDWASAMSQISAKAMDSK